MESNFSFSLHARVSHVSHVSHVALQSRIILPSQQRLLCRLVGPCQGYALKLQSYKLILFIYSSIFGMCFLFQITMNVKTNMKMIATVETSA